jgi:hypothetical protein
VAKITAIMQDGPGRFPYNKYWPLPERRLVQFKGDKLIFDQLQHGIRSTN